jgi:hypothetical protein
MTLHDILMPLSVEQFATTILGENWLKQRVAADDMQRLVTWPEIDRVLETTRIGDGRIALAKNGKNIDPSLYAMVPEAGGRSLVRSAEVCALLRAGASLVLKGAEEIFDRVKALADSCETSLNVPCHVNLYAGWGGDRGFDLHWDEHDTLILQVRGRKHWRLYRPTRLHPLRKDIASAPQPASGDLVWDGTLEMGEMLYMPRGWWHVAVPMNEPTLHLTFGLTTPTGALFMSWLLDELKRSDVLREDVRCVFENEWLPAYAGRLKEIVNGRLDENGLREFLGWWASKGVPRPRFDLEHLMAPASIELSDDSTIRLTQGRRLTFRRGSGGTTTFEIGDRVWSCSSAQRQALATLNNLDGVAVRDLCELLPQSERTSFKMILKAIHLGGGLEILPASRASVMANSLW